MEIKGKVHCFFEQSGTFKNEFKKLGIPAEDYDIQNNFGETDHVTDLFKAIEDAYDGKYSLFDNITKDDLIIAFFPCIYFCEKSQCAMTLSYINYRNLSQKEKINKIIERSKNRQYFYELILKLFAIAYDREIRLIVENPYSPIHYLTLSENFIIRPTIIDKDRTRRGDFYKKPTSYWFVNCFPTNGFTYQQTPKSKQNTIEKSKQGARAGLCSEERSMISPDYARNFICDYILGNPTGVVPQQGDLFERSKGRKRGGEMKKSNCKFCKEGVVLNPKCDKVVSKYYCDIDAYDKETGCTNCPYKKKSEVRDED